MGPVEILKQGTKEMGMEISQNQIEQFIRYKDILLEWNRKMNLTAITEEKEIIIMHFLDSISCIQTEYFSAGPPSGSAASTTEPIQPTAGSVRLKGRPVPSTEGPTQPTAGSVRGKAEVTLPYSGKNKIKIIDVGTGAGFPGIPLKIMLPRSEERV